MEIWNNCKKKKNEDLPVWIFKPKTPRRIWSPTNVDSMATALVGNIIKIWEAKSTLRARKCVSQGSSALLPLTLNTSTEDQETKQLILKHGV